MISFEEAYKLVLDKAQQKPIEKCTLYAALGRTLAEDVVAKSDAPAFDKSAMDGYAVRTDDLEQEMEVVELIAAGDVPKRPIAKGQCAKIMTGAMMPMGADAVVMVEDTQVLANKNVKYVGKPIPKSCDPDGAKGFNVRYRGEDSKAGEVIIKAGTTVGAQHIAIMAGAGYAVPQVYAKAKVGVLVTGSELVEVDQEPEKGQIRNSNGPQMFAQLAQLGLVPTYYGIAPDNQQATLDLIKKAKAENDVLLLSGGVSMGDYDYVPAALAEAGYEIQFRKIAVQPGKPTLFATAGDTYCFALPGNPISSFIQFELLVKPFLLKLSGAEPQRHVQKLPLGEDFSRKKAGRLAWFPIAIRNGKVFSVPYNGSGHINALAAASGFVAFSIGTVSMKTGDLVEVCRIE